MTPYFPNSSNIVQFAYKYYTDWLLEGNEDLHLPAFKLTSQQMFWLSYAHVTSEKYQRGVSKFFEIASQLIKKYMHVVFKSILAFRIDFQCDEMTAKEMQLLTEFEKKSEYLRWAKYLRVKSANYHFSLSDLPKGLIEFTELMLAKPEYAKDLKILKHSLKKGECNYEIFSKVFSIMCPSDKDCELFF